MRKEKPLDVNRYPRRHPAARPAGGRFITRRRSKRGTEISAESRNIASLT